MARRNAVRTVEEAHRRMLVDLMGRCGPDSLLVDRRPDGAELTVRSATALRRSGASAVAERDSRGDGLPGGGLEFSDFCTAYRPSLVALGGANGLVAAYVGFPRLLTGAYVRLFRWIVQPVRRRQELEADAAAAEVCDAPQRAEALVRQAMAGQLWPRFQQVFLDTAPGGVLPTDPFRSFAPAVSSPGIRDRLPHLRADVVTGPTVRTELGASHPDLAERLRNPLEDAPLPAEPSFRPDAALIPALPSGDVARLLPPPGGTHPQGTAIGAPPLIRAAPRGVKVCRTELP
ncbi:MULTISPECIES: M48 family metalloprotease [Streptomyces]|uniref:M48 family metalloprotease n=1 Tax=Streptomyces TaxID=1883 RepID=UPI003443666C